MGGLVKGPFGIKRKRFVCSSFASIQEAVLSYQCLVNYAGGIVENCLRG